MKYNKRVREEAALICAVAASGGTVEHYGRTFVYGNIRDALGVRVGASLSLAVRAWQRASAVLPWTREVDGEAEALIRTGWSP